MSEDRGETRRDWDRVPDAVVVRAKNAFSFRRQGEELIPLVSNFPAGPAGEGPAGEDAVFDDDVLQFARTRMRVRVAVSGDGLLALLRATVSPVWADDARRDLRMCRVSLECADADHGQTVVGVIAERDRRAGEADAVFCVPHGVVRLRITEPDGGRTAAPAYHTDWFMV